MLAHTRGECSQSPNLVSLYLLSLLALQLGGIRSNRFDKVNEGER